MGNRKSSRVDEGGKKKAGTSFPPQAPKKPAGSMGNTPGTNFGNADHSKAQVSQTDSTLGKQIRRHEQDRVPDQNDSARRKQ